MTFLGFITANLFRNDVRSLLTIFSLLVAFLLFIVLGSVSVIFTADIELEGGANRLQTTAKYSIIDVLPERYVQEIQALSGVDLVTHATWFNGTYQDPKNAIPTFPVDPSTYFAVMDEIDVDPETLSRFTEIRRSMVAPVEMAEEYGWKVGDLIPLGSPIYPMNDGSPTWEFEFAGTYSHGQDFGAILINYFYFDEARAWGRGTVGWIITRVEDPELVSSVATEIDGMYQNSMDPVRSAPESAAMKDFLNQYGNIGLMMSGILSAVFFTMVLLTANTMSQAFRERIPELAVLKTIGFSDTKVSFAVILEAILQCLIPAIISVILAIPLVMGLSVVMSALPMGFPFALNNSVLIGTLGISIFLGVLVGFVPAITAKRLTIIEALRT